MKNLLLATTALVMMAGAASADVKISGTGRFGIVSTSSDDLGPNDTKTQMNTRLRLNLDASMTSDAGVTFGGRIRVQYDQNTTGANPSAADLYASFGGLRLDVGNVGTAYDDSALMYNSEIDFISEGFGDPQGSYYSFSSGPYNAVTNTNRMGINASYSVGALNVEASFVTPDQTAKNQGEGMANEAGISGNYTFGKLEVAAAYVKNGNGIKDNDNTFVGVEYAVSDALKVGLQYFDDGDTTGTGNGGSTTQETLYGSYKITPALTGKAYVSHVNSDAVDNLKTAYGIGANYDLGGGAEIAGGYHSGFVKGAHYLALGVDFSF